jgi:ferric enterobactin receptor
MRNRLLVFVLSCLLLVIAIDARAQSGSIHGVVQSADGQPVHGAIVTIHGTGISTNTDAYGRYVFANLRPGAQATLTVSADGFEPWSRVITVLAEPYRSDFTLRLAGVTETVSVTAEIPMLNASDGISKVALAPEQIAVLPSLGEQDIFRAYQLLPGVVGTNESSSGLFVRGGTPDQNLISYDGFTAYHVDHLFGYFSAFNMDAVEQVELSKTATEARHGGRLSGVMDITGKAGSTEKAEFGAGVSLLSAHALASVPLGDKASVLLAGRHSYQSSLYNKILNLVDSGSAAGPARGRAGPGGRTMFSTQPESSFYDLNGKLLFAPGANDNLTASVYYGNDDLDNSRSLEIPSFVRERLAERGIEFDSDNIDITDESGWGNTGVGAQWSRRWGDRAQSLLSFGYSNHRNQRDRTSNMPNRRGGLAEDNNLDDFTARLAVPIQLGWNHQLELGGQITSNDVRYTYGTGAAETEEEEENETDDNRPAVLGVLDREEQGTYHSAYIQDRATLFGKLVITPGLRFSRYDRTATGYLEPRIAASLEVATGVRLKGSWGRNNQYVNRIVREDVLGGNREFWALSDGDLIPVPKSTNLVVGTSYETGGFLVDVEAFRNEQTRLTTFAPRFTPGDEGIDYDEYFYEGDGESEGLELLLQKKFGSHTGWASYTLSKTDYLFPELEADPFPADHDQRHELKLVYSARFANWTFSGVYIFGSGRPYTEPIGTEEVELGDEERPFTVERVVVGGKNGARLPTYQRLDLSANLDFELFSSKGTLGLTVFNVGDRKNIWYKEFTSVDGEIFENNILLMSRTYNLFLNVRF